MPDSLLVEEIRALVKECRAKLDELEEELTDLENGKTDASPALVNRVFKAFHDVKSTASYLGRDNLERLNAIPEPPRGGTANAARAPHPAHRLRVLVVEDDFTSRVVLQGLLSKYGDCHIAVNGQEALDAFRSAWQTGQLYDLVCMDIRMPEMNGQEAVRQMRAIEREWDVSAAAGVKIFMTTAIQDMKSVMASFKVLCDAYLFKPIEGAKLEEHLTAFGLIR